MSRYGAFRAVGEIGRGGMGVVLLGVQDGLERPVAIKVLSGQDDSLAARLRHEATLLADLQHPHVVGVLDVGEVDGRPYLVMPYLPGGTLAGVLRRDGALTPGQVTGVVSAVAEALAAAHARGVLHRDVKPQNVLLSASGDPYLSDFGIASGSSQTRTTSGELLGTVGYVAPEVIAGLDATEAADVYALGVMAYTLLAGRGPLPSSNLMAALEAARTGRHVPLADTAPETPLELQRLVTAAMALEPADRPADLRQYADDLRAASRPEPVVPLPDTALALMEQDALTQLGGRAALHAAEQSETRDPGPARSRLALVLAGAAALVVVGAGAGALASTGPRGLTPSTVVDQAAGKADAAGPAARQGASGPPPVGSEVPAGGAPVPSGGSPAEAVVPAVTDIPDATSVLPPPGSSSVPGPVVEPASGSGSGASGHTAQQPTAQQPTPQQPTAQQPAPQQPAPQQPTAQQPTPKQPTAQQPTAPQQPAPPPVQVPGSVGSGSSRFQHVAARQQGSDEVTQVVVAISWSAPSGGGAPTAYDLRRSVVNGSGGRSVQDTTRTGGSSATLTVPAVHVANGRYSWEVRAVNSAGASGWVELAAEMVDMRGQLGFDATQMIRTSGALVGYADGGNTPPPSPSQAYRVYNQSPAGGRVGAGALVKLWYYGG